MIVRKMSTSRPITVRRVISSLVFMSIGCNSSAQVNQARDGATTPEHECQALDRESCAANELCKPIIDSDANYYECIEDIGCGDDNTCGKHGKLIAEFRSTCLPSGWTSVPYSICEESRSPCIDLADVECQDSITCAPLIDSNGVYHECANRTQCGDAPVCGESDDGLRATFPIGCLPSGWQPVSPSRCAQDAGDCTVLQQAECSTTEICRALTDNSGVYHGCTLDGNCGDDNVCATNGDLKVMFTTTCVPNGWDVLPIEECS